METMHLSKNIRIAYDSATPIMDEESLGDHRITRKDGNSFTLRGHIGDLFISFANIESIMFIAVGEHLDFLTIPQGGVSNSILIPYGVEIKLEVY